MTLDNVKAMEKMPPSEKRLASPCIQVCRIDSTTQRCEGCRRTLDEIARWRSMSETERAAVWARLAADPHSPA
ncbi:DUF1289 domain-containing protein [Billgrantia gudaonensis]|uniref:DUF1289 domain-containing protein n=1 Tax=Billgrantia gudaonensis TaxID=376427 RepID=A0A1G9BBS3_9GAMM|nr:DUF1289 domain-containing protein [Halomonas gudaonensis]SDK36937.1 hypothetical protein SAMN04487954_11566 [Halomonas gudaonensis]